MTDDQPIKTGICDSCGVEAPLYAVKHEQLTNSHVWFYCENCKFAHNREMQVQRVLAVTDPTDANDPTFVANLQDKVANDLIQQKAQSIVAAEEATTPPAEDTPAAEGEVVAP